MLLDVNQKRRRAMYIRILVLRDHDEELCVHFANLRVIIDPIGGHIAPQELQKGWNVLKRQCLCNVQRTDRCWAGMLLAKKEIYRIE
jgi:hypothetical protein